MAESEDTPQSPDRQPASETEPAPERTAPRPEPGDTFAGETAELPDRHDAPTERRPPVDAAAPSAEDEPPRLRDVTGTLGDYLRARAVRLAEAVRTHRLAAALVATVAVAAIVAAVALATSAPSLPSAELVSDDAAARLEAPAYQSGSFGWDDILVPREVDVRSVSRDAETGEATAEVMVTYSGSHGVSAEKAATLRYSATGGTWEAVGDPENVRVSWHTTEGVNEARVIENAGLILERADRALELGDGSEGPTLAELYAGASVTAESGALDDESQTQEVTLTFSQGGAYERYECRMTVGFAFRSASGQWEIESVSVDEGARERSLDPLVGTWRGTFQSQEADGEKCLAARQSELVVTIASARSDAGVEQVTGTVSGVAHYHAGPSSDVASSEGDAALADVPFTAALVEESDGTLTFEGTLPEDVGGTVTLTLAFGSAEDPSRAVARVTTSYVHETSFLFVPYEETFTYADLFALVRAADAE